MDKFNPRAIRSKLFLGIGAAGIIMIILIGISIFRWNDLRDRRKNISEQNIPAREQILHIRNGVTHANTLVFQHISGLSTGTNTKLENLYNSEIDSIKTELDSLIARFATIERKNLYRRLDESFTNLKAVQFDITSTEVSVTDQSLPDLTSYPGYSGDTLLLDMDFTSWYDQQQVDAGQGPLLGNLFVNELLPEWYKLETSIDKLYSSLKEESELEEIKLQTLIGKLIITMIIGLLLLGVGGLFLFYKTVSGILSSLHTVEGHLNVLSKGDIPENLNDTHNDFSNVNKGLKELSNNLLNVKRFAQEVGNGNFDNEIDVFNNQGDIGKSLSDVKMRLKNISEEDRKRNWSNQGFAQFGDILRSNADDLDSLADDIIGHLVKYLGANQGGIFILDEQETDDPVMILRGCYAFDRKKKVEKEIRPGQGLVGQAWQEQESIYLIEVPEEFVNIRSGLGDSSPDCIFIVPLKVNEEVFGVIELASFKRLDDYEKEFVETLSESIASSISAVRSNANTKQLLEESQQMTEEMRAQEEEMRQNMEELQATQEEMQRNSRDINEKEANLQALINNTNDSIITINRNYEVLVLNEQVRNRYKGTQYEGIDVGHNVLDMLGDVRNEWKGYYDQAFSGERLNFTIKSSVSGEDSFRDYFINPIKDTTGEIVGASVFSRDVTERELEKMESESKSAFLDLVEEITKLTAKVEDRDGLFQICLNQICRHMNWAIGHVYFPSEDYQTFKPSELWFMNDDRAEGFKSATKTFSFERGEGLPGRVWESKRPEWMADVTEDPNFPRISSAKEAGLKGAFGFPVEMNQEVIAVLEFYSYQVEEPNEEVLKLVKHVGTQMGHFMERLSLLSGIQTTSTASSEKETTKKMIQKIRNDESELIKENEGYGRKAEKTMSDRRQLRNILFLDLETVSCVQDYSSLNPRLREQWDKKAGYLQNEEALTNDELFFQRAGIYAEFGRIITIGIGFFHWDSDDQLFFRVKSISSHDEIELLSEFLKLLDQFDDDLRLCAHNGKEFDFPYLCRRLLINEMKLPDVLDLSGKKPWEINHLDTMNMWKFGDWKSYTSLDLLSSVLGIESSKGDIDGSMVNKVYYEQEILREYQNIAKKMLL